MSSDNNKTSTERRDQTRTAIDRLLEERQKVLVHYERVAGVQPFDDDLPSPDLLERFSQLLMDYIASGHFGLYQRITEGTERRQSVIDVVEELYPKIAATTEKALDFLERAVAVQAGFSNKAWIENDSNLDPIRETPRFQAILKQIDERG